MSDIERQRDKARIDRLLDAWERELDGDPGIEALVLASRSVVPLLERRSKLLGLDATSESKDAPQPGQTPVQRILAAVPKPDAKAGT